MKIYLNSRGFEQDSDYRWLEVHETGQTRLENMPYILSAIADLIEFNAPSLVLARDGYWLVDDYLADAIKSIQEIGLNREGFQAFQDLIKIDLDTIYSPENQQIILLITGLEPDNWRDFIGRQIRLSIACIGEDCNETEQIFRGLATRTLDEQDRQRLTAEIKQAINFGGKEGVEVNYKHLIKLIEDSKNQALENKSPSDGDRIKIGGCTDVLKAELAADIKKYSLPKNQSPLVIVTDIQTEEALIEAQVWRGLASLVESEEWKILSKPENPTESSAQSSDQNLYLFRFFVKNKFSPVLLFIAFFLRMLG
ncbi:MAG: hypothetical protein AAFO04_00600 [Cyanobacteria bacterium J06592_8]